MQPAKLFNNLQARAQPQVKGIAQNNMGIDFLELKRRHRLHRTVGTHRHKNRRLDYAMIDLKAPAPGLTIGM